MSHATTTTGIDRPISTLARTPQRRLPGRASRRDSRHGRRQNGMALAAVLLLTLIFSLLGLALYRVVTGEQRTAASDRDNATVYYAAQGGLEKMSADIAGLFSVYASPTAAQISSLVTPASQPSLLGITFPEYTISYQTNPDGTLRSTQGVIGGTGPLVGLTGLITPFTLKVRANGYSQSEVRLTRTVQEVSVPVFEFGIFSDNDLSFFAGPNFNFGGRVHTNGDLYLAEGDGSTLTLSQNVTAYGDIIRTQLSNGWPNTSYYNGTVNMFTVPGSYRGLTQSEGSLTGGRGSSPNSNWQNISLSTYNGNIRNRITGARKLNLTVALAGATPIEVIRRPPAGEAPGSNIGRERLYNQASLRVLFSDTLAALPGGTGVALDATLVLTPDACHPPVATALGPGADANSVVPAGTPLLGGFVQIAMQNALGGWQDVTSEILAQGIEAAGSCTLNGITYQPILRLEELKPGAVAGSVTSTDYQPINFYDTREGEVRDISGPATVALAGVMNAVDLDVGNLQSWFAGIIGTSGGQAVNNSGYIFYFSDRRGNHNPALGSASVNETGQFGNEDSINPGSSSGVPNGILETGEDVDGNGVLDTYGATPLPPAGSIAPLDSTATPQTRIAASIAASNPVIFFRHVLRLVDGTAGKLPPLSHANCTTTTGGFSVAAENPVYTIGDYNAAGSFSDGAGACHVPAAIMADAVTVLSNAWNDASSFSSPTSPSGRVASTTWVRAGVIAGKNLSFPKPSWSGTRDFGTDGGAHNFLRYLENWGGQTLNYRGSIVSLFYSRQALGIYKCCSTVYGPPTRGYNFDLDFSNIGSLPPGTPRFTDVNALSFRQWLLPGRDQ